MHLTHPQPAPPGPRQGAPSTHNLTLSYFHHGPVFHFNTPFLSILFFPLQGLQPSVYQILTFSCIMQCMFLLYLWMSTCTVAVATVHVSRRGSWEFVRGVIYAEIRELIREDRRGQSSQDQDICYYVDLQI